MKTIFFEKDKEFSVLFLAVLALFLTYIFHGQTSLCLSFDRCYSDTLIYHLQTEAVSKGDLSLADNPYLFSAKWGSDNYLNDCAWGQGGVYQIWGLAVPVLMLPFKLFWRIFSEKLFPDHLIFLIYYSLLAFFSLSTFYNLMRKLKYSYPISYLSSFSVTVLFLMSDLFLDMISYRFNIYHQGIAYAYLYTYFLFLLFIRLFYSSSLRSMAILFLLAGAAPFFRATTMIYALIIVSAAVLLMRSKVPQFRILVLSPNFFLFPLILLFLNYIRFGSVFEFGYGLNVSSFPLNDYSLRFDYPFSQAGIFDAVMELCGALFQEKRLSVNFSFHNRFFELQGATPRFREFSFQTYSFVDLLVIIISFSGIFVFWADRSRAQFQILLSLIAIGSFVGVGAFYLYAPTIVCRYFVDFQLAINCCYLISFIILVSALSKNSYFNDSPGATG